jgi:hypothetical protein
MNTHRVLDTLLLLVLCFAAAACGVTPPAAAPTADLLHQSHDAWTQTRTSLPANIALYKPTYLPKRFGHPELLEARNDPSAGFVYTIVYAAPNETLAFILNQGKGALGNFPPAQQRTAITVLGQFGDLEVASETHTLGVFWQASSGHYQIKAYSQQMTTDEMTKIIEQLIQQ